MISGVNIRGVPSFVDSTVLLSWHSSLLTGLPRFRDTVAQLTA